MLCFMVYRASCRLLFCEECVIAVWYFTCFVILFVVIWGSHFMLNIIDSYPLYVYHLGANSYTCYMFFALEQLS